MFIFYFYFFIIFVLIEFSDHLRKDDILYVNIYTEDGPKNKIIGVVQIKLHKLFKKGMHPD